MKIDPVVLAWNNLFGLLGWRPVLSPAVRSIFDPAIVLRSEGSEENPVFVFVCEEEEYQSIAPDRDLSGFDIEVLQPHGRPPHGLVVGRAPFELVVEGRQARILGALRFEDDPDTYRHLFYCGAEQGLVGAIDAAVDSGTEVPDAAWGAAAEELDLLWSAATRLQRAPVFTSLEPEGIGIEDQMEALAEALMRLGRQERKSRKNALAVMRAILEIVQRVAVAEPQSRSQLAVGLIAWAFGDPEALGFPSDQERYPEIAALGGQIFARLAGLENFERHMALQVAIDCIVRRELLQGWQLRGALGALGGTAYEIIDEISRKDGEDMSWEFLLD